MKVFGLGTAVGAALGLGLGLLPGQTLATPGTPVTIASGTAASGTLTLTTTQDTPAGSLIVVAASGANNQTVSSITDSATGGSNTYAAAYNTGVASRPMLAVFYSYTVHDLPNGASITITNGGSATTAAALSASNMASSQPDSGATIVATNGAATTGPATAAVTGTLAAAAATNGAVIINTLSLGSTDSTYTPSCSPGTCTSLSLTSGNSHAVGISYQVVSATTSISATPSWGTSTAYINAVFAFDGAAANHFLILTGVGK